MPRTPQDVTDAELGVLQALWDGGPATVRRLTDALYPRGGVSHYATVQKLLERLEAKRYVRRDRSASVHVFAAAVGRDELIGRRLRSIADKLCGGSLTPLLSHLIQTGPLSAAERHSLRQLVEELDTRERPPTRPAKPPRPRA
jgi:predicted transcriptional regulator